MRTALLLLAAASITTLSGCGVKYTTPGPAADMKLIQQADYDIAKIEKMKPLSPIPASLVACRIQGSGYYSYSCRSYGRGDYSVVTVKDIETDDDFKRISNLENISQVGTINRMLLPEHLCGNKPLRQAAAMLHADMLLLYTIDTHFEQEDMAVPLSVITLGLSPNVMVHVNSTASAILMDVRTGYIYGAVEGSENRKQLASQWTEESAVDQSRRKTERTAFENMIGEFEKAWPEIVAVRKKQLGMK